MKALLEKRAKIFRTETSEPALAEPRAETHLVSKTTQAAPAEAHTDDIGSLRKLEFELVRLREREQGPLKALTRSRQRVKDLTLKERSYAKDATISGWHRKMHNCISGEFTKAQQELEVAERDYAQISSAITETSKKISEAWAQRDSRYTSIVAEAVEAASEHRDKFRAEREKLLDLRGKQAELENRLQQLLQPAPATEGQRVQSLLDSGQFPAAATAPTAEIQEARANLHTVTRAIDVQDLRTKRAKSEFAAEVRRHLKAAFTEIASRSGAAMQHAEAAVKDEYSLAQAFTIATGEIAPIGVACRISDGRLQNWLENVNRLGYLESGE